MWVPFGFTPVTTEHGGHALLTAIFNVNVCACVCVLVRKCIVGVFIAGFSGVWCIGNMCALIRAHVSSTNSPVN